MDLATELLFSSSYGERWTYLPDQCSTVKLGFQDLIAAASTLDLCYYPLLVGALSCFFAIVFVVRNSFHNSITNKRKDASARAERGSGVCLSIFYGLLFLFSIWKWWQRGWHYQSLHELVFLGSQLLVWALVTGVMHQNSDVVRSTLMKVWWMLLLVLTCAGTVIAIAKGSWYKFSYLFDIALLCAPILSSLYFLYVSFRKSTSIPTELNTPLLDDAQRTVPTRTKFSHAGWFSLITFSWLNPLLSVGNQKPLTVEDVPFLDPEDHNNVNFTAFQRSWELEASSSHSKSASRSLSVWRALWNTFRAPFFFCLMLTLAWSCALFTGPILQNQLIKFVNEDGHSLRKGLTLVLILFNGKMIESASKHQFNFRSRKLGLQMWSAVGCAVHAKTLRLSHRARQDRSVGEITNLLSTDVQRLLELQWYLCQGFAVPLQVVIAVFVLFYVVGSAMVVGLLVLLTFISLNALVVRYMRRNRVQLLAAKDRRMQMTTECLGNMKVVKLQAWDAMFRNKIMNAREVEVSWLLKFVYNFALSVLLTWTGPLAVAASIFLVMILRGEVLTTATAFTALTTIRIIQEPIRFCPDILSNVLQAVVSLHRVSNFLCEDEIDDDAVTVQRVPAGDAESLFAVEMEDATFSWDRSESPTIAFSNISVKIKRGACVAVCGGVGSGKSSLLYSMLGELPKMAGKAKRSGRCAYVSQTAWIQNNTIKENILFGREFDFERYDRAVKVSGLETDLAQMPEGDATEIGEKGTNMSGGQKQRIQLARAVYEDADVYFLDDPFSAVDAHTGTFLFEECIQGVLKDKTVVLVTHQVEFLPAADLILVLKNGKIVQKGSYAELVQEGKDFTAFVKALQDSLVSVIHGSNNESQDDELINSGSRQKSVPTRASSRGSKSRKQKDSLDVVLKKKGRLIHDEERAEGRVDKKVIWMYVTKVYYGLSNLLVIVLQLTAIGCQLGSDVWMAWGTSQAKGSSLQLVEVYILLVVGCGIAVITRACLVVQTGVWTAQSFYVGMLDSIIRAPLSYLDSTPLGRILSRSSTDQSALDLDLPMVVSQCTNTFISTVSILCITSFVTPAIIPVLLFLAWIFLNLQGFYIKSARELSRVTAMTEAPVFLHMSETIAGAITIRAFEDQNRFRDANSKLFDNYQRAYFHNLTATSWLGIRLESLAAIVLSSAALLLVSLPKNSIAPGMAGLAISYGLSLSNLLQMMVNAYSMLENKMVCVERIDQYSNIQSEAPAFIPDRNTAADWPSEGRIEVQNLQIRYQGDGPLVLNGISCVIHPREKVGVVGRTGSGKSTLIQAIFRLTEPAGGRIFIDGVDIGTIGLHDLRSRLSVIPQEPTLFEGTIRSNLDPFNAYSDQQLWQTLEKCALAEAVEHKPGKLDSSVSEQGENWSVGERQLLCLGRALLKHARIIVLDEATASVDINTDAIIQKTIKHQFADSTIISVAHRIPTVMDSDRVLVLDAGYVMENSSPGRLLSNVNSLFAKLVEEYRARNYSSSYSSFKDVQ